MKLRKNLFQLFSAEFWAGLCVALIVFFVISIAHISKKSPESSNTVSRGPTEKEIISAFVKEDGQVKCYKCNGYMVGIALRKNIPESLPPRAKSDKPNFFLFIPGEYSEYIGKLIEENSPLTFDGLSNILVPCEGDNGKIIYKELSNYLEFDIEIYGMTIEPVDNVFSTNESELHQE
jgi:hypothetical protein